MSPADGSGAVGVPVQQCSVAQKKEEKKKPDVPCNLDQIQITLTPAGLEPAVGAPVKLKPVVVRNTALAISPPAKDSPIPEEDRKRMTGYSAYVHRRLPFTAPGASSPSHTRATTSGNNVGSRKVSVDALVTAGQRCGLHPDHLPIGGLGPLARVKGDKIDSFDLEIQRAGLDFEWFKKTVFGGGWSKLGDAAEHERIVVFNSCGAPSRGRGDPRATLSALVRLSSLDDWSVEISSPAGIKIEFGKTRATTWDHRNDVKVRKATSKYADDVFGEESESDSSATTATQGGSRVYASVMKDGEENIRLSRGPSGNSATVRTADLDRQTGELKKALSFEEESAQTKKKTTAASILKSLTYSFTWNGETISTKDVQKTIEAVVEALFTIWDIINQVYTIIDEGLKVGFPITVTKEFGFELEFFKGAFAVRRWVQVNKALEGPGYYVDVADSRWQASLKACFMDVKLTAAIGVMLQVIHKKVLSLEVKISATPSVVGNAQFNLTFGDDPCSVVADVTGALLIEAIGEGVAGPYYATAEAKLRGAIKAEDVHHFDGFELRRERRTVTNQACTVQLEVFKGKRKEFFSVEGRGEPWKKWPKEGPFVLVKENELNKAF